MAKVSVEWTDVEQAREQAYAEHIRSRQQRHENKQEQLDRIERKLDELLRLLS